MTQLQQRCGRFNKQHIGGWRRVRGGAGGDDWIRRCETIDVRVDGMRDGRSWCFKRGLQPCSDLKQMNDTWLTSHFNRTLCMRQYYKINLFLVHTTEVLRYLFLLPPLSQGGGHLVHRLRMIIRYNTQQLPSTCTYVCKAFLNNIYMARLNITLQSVHTGTLSLLHDDLCTYCMFTA